MKISDDFMAGSPLRAPESPHDSPGSDPESGHGGSEAGATEARAGGLNGSPGPASKAGVIEILLLFVQEIASSGGSLIEVTKDRLRLRMRRSLIRLAIGAVATLCVLVWTGASALAILRGICGGFTSLFAGREWLGDLVGGLVALTIIATVVALHLRLTSRREFERLKAKYERMRNEHKNTDSAPARNGGGVARPAGSPGDPADHGLGAAHG